MEAAVCLKPKVSRCQKVKNCPKGATYEPFIRFYIPRVVSELSSHSKDTYFQNTLHLIEIVSEAIK